MKPKLERPQRQFFYQLPFQSVVIAVTVSRDRVVFAFYDEAVSNAVLTEAQRRNLSATEVAHAQVAVDKQDVDEFIKVIGLEQRLIESDAEAMRAEAMAIAERLRIAIDS